MEGSLSLFHQPGTLHYYPSLFGYTYPIATKEELRKFRIRAKSAPKARNAEYWKSQRDYLRRKRAKEKLLQLSYLAFQSKNAERLCRCSIDPKIPHDLELLLRLGPTSSRASGWSYVSGTQRSLEHIPPQGEKMQWLFDRVKGANRKQIDLVTIKSTENILDRMISECWFKLSGRRLEFTWHIGFLRSHKPFNQEAHVDYSWNDLDSKDSESMATVPYSIIVHLRKSGTMLEVWDNSHG